MAQACGSGIVVELNRAILDATYKVCRKKVHQIVFCSRPAKSSGAPECRAKIRYVISRFATPPSVHIDGSVVSRVGIKVVKQNHQYFESVKLTRIRKWVLLPAPG